MTSERLREREVHRYYQSWVDSSIGFRNTDPSATARYYADRSKLVLSKDKALMAFAQLGCLKLDVKRGVIALISTSRMYFLAEATKTLSLASETSEAGGKDEIWFATSASIPRSESVSESTLTAGEYTARDENGLTFTATARVINDITKDPQYADRDYAGNGVTFYCGVPLVTDSGFPIGVYSMSDDRPRPGISPDELRFLCDMATTTLRHLDTVRNEAARFRGETMIFGLGRFMRGFSSVEEAPTHTIRSIGDVKKNSDQSFTTSNTASAAATVHKFKGMSITVADPAIFHILTSDTSPTEEQNETEAKENLVLSEAAESMPNRAFIPKINRKQGVRSKQDSLNKIYSRAANILRECASADGIVFFDAVSTNFAKRSSITEFRSSNKNDAPAPRSKVASETETRNTDNHEHGSSTPIGVSSDSDDAADVNNNNILCQLLGYSVKSTETMAKTLQTVEGLSIHERTIRRLIKKYPEGKVFHFNTGMNKSSSDLDQSTGTASDAGLPTTEGENVHEKMADVARALKRALPSAQSVVWLPIWDFMKQRWSAGALLWSRKSEQLAVAQDNFIYLKAFANSIMTEIARLDAALSDEAKATFIANISHELRSPLHGIIGNCEILQDTSLDHFQTSLVASIELCGRTLNDTFDHVLDYAKINQLSKRPQQLKDSGRQPSLNPNSFTPDRQLRQVLDCDFDLATLVEEAVETVYVSRSFRPNLDLIRKAQSATLGRNKTEATDFDSKNVQVTLRCENHDDWHVRAEAGAIQRIVINLFSNALKYTNAGLVEVSLATLQSSLDTRQRQDDHSKSIEQVLNIVLTIRDTGKGMSDDFVRNYAFTPFRQESSFTEGTGLGLSIVQQLVDSMGGKIELKSKLNVGTEIKVYLTLEQPERDGSAEVSTNSLRTFTTKTSGVPICFLSQPGRENKLERTKRQGVEKALIHTAETWFSMQTIRTTSARGVQAGIFLYLTAPSAAILNRECTSGILPTNSAVIVLTANVPQVAEMRNQCVEQFESQGIWLEVISHPVGPRKLSNVLSNCLERMNMMENMTPSRTLKKIPVGNESLLKTGRKRSRSSRSMTRSTTLQSTPTTMTTIESCKSTTVLPSSLDPSHSTVKPQIIDTPPDVQATSQSYNKSTMPTSSPNTTLPFTANAPAERKRVLLVEDNAINLNILRMAMTQAKISFATATNGLDALETFKKNTLGVDAIDGTTDNSFTHILMDISMPVMDGIEATRLIREFERDTTTRQRRKSVAIRSEQNISELRKSETSQYSVIHPTEETTAGASAAFDTSLSSTQSDYLARPKLVHAYTQPPQKRSAMIIAISGDASDQAQRDMFNAGADIFMAKPVKPKEIARLIRGEPVISP